MNKSLLVIAFLLWITGLQGQVTQINSNQSLSFIHPLSSTKAIFVSAIDNHLWVTDGTLAGTISLSPTITYDDYLGSTAFLNGQFIFAGTTAATGTELYITDGTPGGTMLLKDIYLGNSGSYPIGDAAVLNGYIYFTAETVAEGRELWRTNGTPAGTTLVKDIVPGPAGSNSAGLYALYSNGTFLLLMAATPASGIELWKSDGTDPGTILLKDINVGPGSPGVQIFFTLNNLVLFIANDGVNGIEPWRSDGTPGGTYLLKDINPGPPNSSPLFFPTFFVNFLGKSYFTANEPVNGEEIWSTDGTTANTNLLKDIEPGPFGSLDILVDGVVANNNLFFPSTSLFSSRYQIWQTNGTGPGTNLFWDFTPGMEIPFLFPPFNQTGQQVLFNGKFFFMGRTLTDGTELWITDGTPGNTNMVKDIYTGAPGGLNPTDISYLYTSTNFFFPASNGTNGTELWKSDGTSGGTSMVADIITGAMGSNPQMVSFIVNGKVLFGATNGDDPLQTDLYAVDGTFIPIPVKLGDFTVFAQADDAVLQWHTYQEINSKDFTVQRSFDAIRFENIGVVAAAGNSSSVRGYDFIDPGIVKSGRNIIYYRLLSTDKDGKKELSHVGILKIKGAAWDASLVNNPVSDQISLALTRTPGNVKYAIADMSGKIIVSKSIKANNTIITIPFRQNPGGVYTLIVYYEGEQKLIRFTK